MRSPVCIIRNEGACDDTRGDFGSRRAFTRAEYGGFQLYVMFTFPDGMSRVRAAAGMPESGGMPRNESIPLLFM